MAILTKKLKISSMACLSEKIYRDPTSLSKLARKGILDPQLEAISKDLLQAFVLQI